MAATAMLQIDGIEAFYGRVRALANVTLKVGAGEVVALIGSNGAGKTTTLRTISGLVHAARGRISFAGQDMTAVPPAKRVELGIGHVPEGRRLFPRMSVQDNLTLVAYTRNERAETAEIRVGVLDQFARF